MPTDLERVLERAKYAALPLPRAKAGPTTIFGFTGGMLHIVRNPRGCLPDPPLSVTSDPAVDTLVFEREFSFTLKGFVGFLAHIFGSGSTKATLEAKSVSSASVRLGGLSHDTIETGVLIDYLLQQPAGTPCQRDLLDKDHLTIVAALKASTFTYRFKNAKGVTVGLTTPEASNLFKVDASVNVEVSQSGEVTVQAPSYVGVITWSGAQIAKQLAKARKVTTRPALRASEVPTALEGAMSPVKVYELWQKGFPMSRTTASVKPRRRVAAR